MNIIAIVIGLIVIAVIAVRVALWVIIRPRKMSIDEMNIKVRNLRKFYSNLSLVERTSYTGRQILKSIRYLEKKIREAAANVA